MLSRVAENLYWMARYIERAEDTARLISVNSQLMLDLPPDVSLEWAALVDITGSGDSFVAGAEGASERDVLHFLCTDRTHGGSIISSLEQARENLRTTRDVVPREIWEQVNLLHMSVMEQAGRGLTLGQRNHFLKGVARGCQTLTGLLEGTLSHGMARRFIQLGRQVERADMTTRILDVRSASLMPRDPEEELLPFENLLWMSVLNSLTAYQMYRQQVRLRVRGPDVLRFLLQDVSLPRAVGCTLAGLSSELQALPRHERPLGEVIMLRAEVAEADIQALSASPDALHDFIDSLQMGFGRIHAAIARSYFPDPVEIAQRVRQHVDADDEHDDDDDDLS